jgi:hypothetical protein
VDGVFTGCDADGNPTAAVNCADSGKVCGTDAEGKDACVDAPVSCTPSCDGDGKFVDCDADGNAMSPADCDEGKVCGDKGDGTFGCVDAADCTVGEGETAKTVEHGAYICAEDGRQVCDNGTMKPAACEGELGACVDGACVACVADETKCVIEDGVHKQYTCGEGNVWGEGEPCAEGEFCDDGEGGNSCKPLNDLLTCPTDSMSGCDTLYGMDYVVYCDPDSGEKRYVFPCEGNTYCANQYGSADCYEKPLENGLCGTGYEECDPAQSSVDKAAEWCADWTGDPYATSKSGSDNLVCAATGEMGCKINTEHCKYCGDHEIGYNEMCEMDNDGNIIFASDTFTCHDVPGLDASKKYRGTPECDSSACMLDKGTCILDADTTYITIKSIRDDYNNLVDTATCSKSLTSNTYVFATVEVTGVVTAIRSNGMGFFMEDFTVGQEAGVLVYCQNKQCVNDLAVGDKVTVTSDAVGQYYCEMQLRASDETNSPISVTKLESGVALTSAAITSAELATGNPYNNAYSARLVTLSDVTTGSAYQSSGTKGWPVTDAAGSAIISEYLFGKTLKDSMTADTLYSSVTGVVAYTFNNIAVAPRNADDIVASPAQ